MYWADDILPVMRSSPPPHERPMIDPMQEYKPGVTGLEISTKIFPCSPIAYSVTKLSYAACGMAKITISLFRMASLCETSSHGVFQDFLPAALVGSRVPITTSIPALVSFFEIARA